MLEDVDSSPLDDQHKALFRFVDKVNHKAAYINSDDIRVLHQSDWTDEAIYFAVTICALFNFYNRWVDASGVHPMSDAAHRAAGERIATHGYR